MNDVLAICRRTDPIRIALSVTLAVLLLLPSAAVAAPSQKKAMWGPARVGDVSQFPIYRDLGVGIYQTTVDWRAVAPTQPVHPLDPTDPAYRWDPEVDFAVEEAQRYGIRVSLMVMWTPPWANGGQRANVPPLNPQNYAKFVEAVSRRYPTVKLFMVWGEPIRSANYLQHPSASTNGYYDPDVPFLDKLPTFSKRERMDAQRYARILDATYGRLKRRDRRNLVIGGNTTTTGSVDPFNWAKHLRLKNGKPARMDLWGHNPFGTRGPDLRKDQLAVGSADFSDLDILTPWLYRYLRRSGRNRNLRLFLSEYNAPTDVPSFEFPYYVTRPVQAKWAAAALRITRRSPWIYTLGWIGLRDAPPRADGKETRVGLIDAQGVRKPAYYAFKEG